MPRKPTGRASTTRNVQPKGHDPYRSRRKTGDAMVCDECGVVCHEGRWYWGAPPLGDETGGLCPACQRIRDRYPVGTVRLHGLPDENREEVLGMIRNAEAKEKPEHPLERLIDVEEDGQELVVTTTGMHLARCIAGALRRRFHGGVTVRYPEEECLIRVDWTA